MPLSKLTIPDTERVIEKGSNREVIHVNDPHALVKVAGYLKFSHALTDKSEGIYFRGERKIYGSLSPTIFRNVHQSKSKENRIVSVRNALKEFNDKCHILQGFGEYAHEPLIQHYGVHTTWVDLVDNFWIALWFAYHRAKGAGECGQYLHFERRIPSEEDKYAYVVLVGVDIQRRDKFKPGYFHGPNTEMVDLRMAAPSVFLRPHAQHGLLFRCKGVNNERPNDYSKQIRGIVRVKLSDALDWLGDGKMVGTHSLFPPPFYDSGYRILIESGAKIDKHIGSIGLVGA
ncbi:FRG domain-containing protein [Vibrio diabolicus]|uniref:FRG domain-containing protein n=1 Tax=Vibrio diabolicus TaxID=50719 RepID=UPI0034594407